MKRRAQRLRRIIASSQHFRPPMMRAPVRCQGFFELQMSQSSSQMNGSFQKGLAFLAVFVEKIAIVKQHHLSGP